MTRASIYRKLIVLLFALGGATSCLAATWHTFTKAYNDDMLYFFDVDTVKRNGNIVSVWLKYVKTKAPDNDGSWSTAEHANFDCDHATMQTVAMSAYDASGTFIKAYPQTPNGPKDDIVPDSIGSGLLKAICEPGFPLKKSDLHFAATNNDVFAHTRAYLAYVASQTDTAPK